MRRLLDETWRNFNLGVLNGVFFGIGETLIDPTLVMAAFISHLTHSDLWVGLVSPILDYTWFLPQFWVAGYSQTQAYKLPLYKLTAYIRGVSWIILTASIFFFHEPTLLLAVFMIVLTIAALGAGLGGLSFLEVVSKTVPPYQRGLFFAWRLTLAGIVGIGASAVVQWLLADSSPLQFPNNYGMLFLLATLLFGLGWWAFFLVREPPDAEVLPPSPTSQQLKRAFQFLRTDANYRNFLVLRSALLIAGTAVPFYALYVEQLGGSLTLIGLYLAIFKGANLLADVFLGRVAARWGYHRLMAVASGAGILMTFMVMALVVLAATTRVAGWVAAWWLVPVFIINGLRQAGIDVAGQSLLLEIAPQTDRSLYLGFTNTVLGVVLFIASFSGVVVEVFGLPTFLIITLLTYVVAVYTSLRFPDVIYKSPTPASGQV
jgi:MFS family permease